MSNGAEFCNESRLVIRTVRDKTGAVLYLEGIADDISSRKQTEERLRDSQALYHSLVEHLPQNLFRKDRDGRFTFVNERFCSTVGMKAEEILGKTDFDYYLHSLATKYRSDDLQIMMTGKSLELVAEHQAPGKPTAYVRVINTPLRDTTGAVTGVHGIIWDITERSRAAQELRESEARFRSLTDAAQDAIIMLDPQGQVTFWNQAAERIFGHTSAEAKGVSAHTLIAPHGRTGHP